MARDFYRDDPHWIAVRYRGTCKQCGAGIARGAEAFYFPRHKSMYCAADECGGVAAASFNASAEDEYAYSH